MSAGFDVDGEVFWGTNGAIEAYVEAMAAVAEKLFGSDDPLVTFLRGELAGFFPGKVVTLDAFVDSPDARSRLLRVLDQATHQLLHGDTFTEYGRNWAASVIPELRAKLTCNRNGFWE